MSKEQDIGYLYALRAGISQIAYYIDKVESRKQIHCLNSVTDILLARQLRDAMLCCYGETIPQDCWQYTDAMIFYLCNGVEQDMKAALDRIRRANKSDVDFVTDNTDGFGLAYREIGLGCPNYNKQIAEQLDKFVSCVRDLEIPDKILQTYGRETMQRVLLVGLIKNNRPTSELLRFALTKYFDCPCLNQSMSCSLSKLAQYEKDLLG